MPVLVNSVDVKADPAVVFDYATDLADERGAEKGRATHIERLTPGPIGVGTRYEAHWSGSDTIEVEYKVFDRPRRWTADATSRGLDMVQKGEVSPITGGVRLTSTLDLRPKGLLKLISPLVVLWMRRVEVQNLAKIKRTVEGGQ